MTGLPHYCGSPQKHYIKDHQGSWCLYKCRATGLKAHSQKMTGLPWSGLILHGGASGSMLVACGVPGFSREDASARTRAVASNSAVSRTAI